MRRLTPAELDRTLTDLLGTTGDPAARILPPEQIGGFGNNVDVRSVGADTVDAYNRLALEGANGAVEDPTAVLTCPELFADQEFWAEAESGAGDEVVYYEDHIVLYSEGYVETTMTVNHDGLYAVEALIQGTTCDGEPTRCDVSFKVGLRYLRSSNGCCSRILSSSFLQRSLMPSKIWMKRSLNTSRTSS